MSARAVGLLLGFAADRLLGDPRRFHPVAGFGTVAGVLERRLYADSRPRGAAHTAALVGASIVVGVVAERAARHPAARAGATAVATWTVLGGRCPAPGSPAPPRTARAALRAWRRDAGAHPSPNAGVVEATFAGALGIRLGGTNRYDGSSRLEHRAIMGEGRPVRPEDIGRATRLARRVGIIGAVVSASGALLVSRRTAGRRAIPSG